MNAVVRRLLGWSAVLAPIVHSLTDVMEWMQGGFSPVQLLLNYIAFLPLPAILLGLYAVQRPKIGMLGLWGALTYGFAFVYFASTTVFALVSGVSTYEDLWQRLGWPYTFHGAVMVAGGAAFGWATLRARIFPAWTGVALLLGVVVNAVLALVDAPEMLQTVGTLLRNAGLVGMGWACIVRRSQAAAADPRGDFA